MSREVLSRVYSLALFLFILCKASPSTVLPVDCLEFDIGELEDYLSEVHLENVSTIDMMIGEFKCPATALPFGALECDWARLLLLQRAQPEGSILREKLGRLFRILAVAYIRIDERFDIAKLARPNVSSSTASFARGSSKEEIKRLGKPILNSRETNKTTESFVSPAAPGGEEHFDQREVEETTLASSIVTRVDGRREGTDGISNDPPSTSVTFIAANTSNNIPTNSINENQNNSENYPTNGTANEGSKQTSEHPTRAEQGINNTEGMFLTEKPSSTSQSLVKGQSSANDAQNESDPGLIKVGSTTDHFRGVEHAVNAFVGAKSSATEVVNEEDAASFEPITFPVSESNTFGRVPSSSTFSLNSVGVHKSRTMNVGGEDEEEEDGDRKGEEGIKESGFVGNIQTTTTEIAEADPRNMTTGVGDHPQFYTPMNSEDQENTVDTGVWSLTTGYRSVAGSISRESTNSSDPGMFDVKTTIGPSHDRIPGNDVSTRSFLEQQPVIRRGNVFRSSTETPRNSTNFVADRNEITEASVSREPTLDRAKDNVGDQDTGSKRFPSGSAKSRKRGSLNTDVEKNFRWFYNIGREKKDYASGDRRGIHIECNGDGHDNGGRVS